MGLSTIVMFALALITAIATSFGSSEINNERDALQRLSNIRRLSSTGHSRNKREIWKIYPGTKWCGASNIANNYNDLGLLKKADRCCRAHDKCDKSIEAGKTKYGVTNTGNIALSHCTCDDKFYKCLKVAGTLSSTAIGLLYFDTLKMSCIEEQYQRVCTGGWFWDSSCFNEYKMVITRRKKAFVIYNWWNR